MAKIVDLFGSKPRASAPSGGAARLIEGFSIEVMPRTAAKIDDFRAILPAGTRVYIAHIDGTPIDEMVATASRLRDEGFDAMPHFPARIIKDRATLDTWLSAYVDVGVEQALVLAGGVDRPAGDFTSSMELLDTGLFDAHGIKRIHVAGHPEGNSDIAPANDDSALYDALRWKQAFNERTDAKMALATQFVFETAPVIDWCKRMAAEGIDLPVHLGVAGPAKLQTLIKFAIACGVGPSLRVLKKRALDMSKLLLPFEPTGLLDEIAQAVNADPTLPIEQIHFFPLGGIKTCATYTSGLTAAPSAAARA